MSLTDFNSGMIGVITSSAVFSETIAAGSELLNNDFISLSLYCWSSGSGIAPILVIPKRVMKNSGLFDRNNATLSPGVMPAFFSALANRLDSLLRDVYVTLRSP